MSEKLNFTKQSIKYVDATPDKDYPIRILRAYRENCNCYFADSRGGREVKDTFLKMMNEANDKRAKILDEAILILLGVETGKEESNGAGI